MPFASHLKHLLILYICRALVTRKIKVEWGLDIEEHRLIELEQVKSEGLQIEDETAEEINLESAFSCLESKKKIVNSIELLQHNTTHSKSQNDKCCPPGKSHQSASHSKSKQVQCEICHLHFNMKKELITHKHLHAKKDCELCNKTFRKASLLKRHMKSHSEEHPFECNFCSVKFKWKQHLQDHLNKHTKEKRYECSVCKKTFFYSQNLHGHLLSHSDERPFGCDMCSASFKTINQLKNHYGKHKRSQISNLEAVPQISQLQVGFQMITLCNELIQCRDVKIEMEDEFEVHRDHMIETPLNLKNETNMETDTASINRTMEKYECIFCQKVFPRSANLSRHFVACHPGEKPFQCRICNLKFIQKKQLADHQTGHKKVYECKVCNKMWLYASDLARHLASHSEERPFSCNTCSARFKQKYQLIRHENIHKSTAKYQCKVCENILSSAYSLSRHLKSHSQQRPFRCNTCTSKFKIQYDLTLHQKRHTKVKICICKVCDQTLSCPQTLKEHMRTHSDSKTKK
uniref:C2H2-type domain-containing protein n=1 Tax=Dendroctonus ponderosae TaxID=77166 RepID=A0AAR5PHX0_DENPD